MRALLARALLALIILLAIGAPAAAQVAYPSVEPKAAQALILAQGGPAYLGQVATRTRFPNAVDMTSQQAMYRSADFVRDDIASVQLVYCNFYKTVTGEANPGFALTIRASVEYPAGTFTQVKFGGSASATMADGTAMMISDPVTIRIPRGAGVFWNTWTSGAGILFSNYGYYTGIGDQTLFGASVADMTMATWSSGSGGRFYGPCAVIAQTRRPSIAIIGDSRVEGVGDTLAGGNGAFGRAIYQGEIVPGLAPWYAVLDMSKGSFQAHNVAQGGLAKRAQYLRFVTHAVDELGINDYGIGPSDTPTLVADRAYIRSLGPNLKWFETTLSPNSSSSVAIAALGSSGTTATATITATQASALKVGQTIFVTGAVPAGYNGTVTVSAVSGQQVSYTLPAGASGLAAATTTGTMSDLWASYTFQSVKGYEFKRTAFNDLVRQGTPGVEGYFDIADAVENLRNGGLWKAPPSVFGALSGDGLHGNLDSWTLDRQAINPALIRRINALDWRDLPRVPANDDAAIERIAA